MDNRNHEIIGNSSQWSCFMPMWNDPNVPIFFCKMHSKYIKKNFCLQEMASDHNRVQAVSSPRYKNWAWQVHGNSNNNVSPVQVFSIAASSGFPSSAANTAPSPAANFLSPNLQGSNASAYNFGRLHFPAPASSPM